MTIQESIDAAGIVPVLRNADAEQFAQDIAGVIFDRQACQALFVTFHAAHPDLKAWEVQAIRGRAYSIAHDSQKPATA